MSVILVFKRLQQKAPEFKSYNKKEGMEGEEGKER